MEKEADTDKILRAIVDMKDDFAGLKGEFADLRSELKGDIAELRSELKGDTAELRGEFAELRIELKGDIDTLRTEDIEPMKQDISAIKKDVEKIRTTFAPRMEYDDRLRVVEQKLGIPTP